MMPSLTVLAFFYAIGVITAFGVATAERVTFEDYGHSRTRQEEYRQACRRQLRAPLWPVDLALFIGRQVRTAVREVRA